MWSQLGFERNLSNSASTKEYFFCTGRGRGHPAIPNNGVYQRACDELKIQEALGHWRTGTLLIRTQNDARLQRSECPLSRSADDKQQLCWKYICIPKLCTSFSLCTIFCGKLFNTCIPYITYLVI